MLAFLLVVSLIRGTDPNDKPRYGDHGAAGQTARAYVDASIGYRSKQFSADDAMNGLERNCGVSGALWARSSHAALALLVLMAPAEAAPRSATTIGEFKRQPCPATGSRADPAQLDRRPHHAVVRWWRRAPRNNAMAAG